MTDEKDYAVSPLLMGAALRQLKETPDAEEGDLLELKVNILASGQVKVAERTLKGVYGFSHHFFFQVLDGTSLKYKTQQLALLAEHWSVVPKVENCPHPEGCGDPCRWCELRRLATNLVDACVKGDLERTNVALGNLMIHLRTQD